MKRIVKVTIELFQDGKFMQLQLEYVGSLHRPNAYYWPSKVILKLKKKDRNMNQKLNFQ